MTRPKQTPVLALAVLLAAGCVGEGYSKEQPAPPPPVQKPAPQVTLPSGSSALDHLPDVVERTLPGVVGISTKRTVTMRAPMRMAPFGMGFFGGPQAMVPQQREQEGMGSGVVVAADGLILTNNHVIDGADEILVKLYEGDQYEAEVVGSDPKSDVAVVKLKDPPAGLHPVPIGDSDALRLGEPVVAIGNPFGLSSTVTLGIVSAKGRENVGIVDYEDFIQTDAAINPGNSGGALVNLRGELVGINTAILSRSGGYQGIGFAIPTNMAASIKDSIVKNGKVTRGWLGVAIQTVTHELAEAFEMPADTRGVIISDVEPNSPAQKGGLKRGDVIVKLNDRTIEDATALRNAVAMEPPGTHVGVEILRDQHSMVVDVELGELGIGQADHAVSELDGLTLGAVDSAFRATHQLPDQLDGVGVVDVEQGSVAARLGLRPGDVIVEVNRTPVKNPKDFERAYDAAKQRVLFLVYRDGRTVFLAMPKP